MAIVACLGVVICFFSANVSVHRTAHFVRCTVQRLVGTLFLFILVELTKVIFPSDEFLARYPSAIKNSKEFAIRIQVDSAGVISDGLNPLAVIIVLDFIDIDRPMVSRPFDAVFILFGHRISAA